MKQASDSSAWKLPLCVPILRAILNNQCSIQPIPNRSLIVNLTTYTDSSQYSQILIQQSSKVCRREKSRCSQQQQSVSKYSSDKQTQKTFTSQKPIKIQEHGNYCNVNVKRDANQSDEWDARCQSVIPQILLHSIFQRIHQLRKNTMTIR